MGAKKNRLRALECTHARVLAWRVCCVTACTRDAPQASLSLYLSLTFSLSLLLSCSLALLLSYSLTLLLSYSLTLLLSYSYSLSLLHWDANILAPLLDWKRCHQALSRLCSAARGFLHHDPSQIWTNVLSRCSFSIVLLAWYKSKGHSRLERSLSSPQ